MLWDLFIPSKTSLQVKNPDTGKIETIPAVKLLDPYCNTGDSIAYAKEKLNLDVYGVEIQRLYAEEAQKKFGLSHVIWGDSHQDVTMSQIAFDVVYLNPPYNEDPGSGMFVSNRAENAALREFWDRLQPNGVMIMVMYLHNLNREIIDSFSNRCNKVHFYRFPELHLDRYYQIVIVGQRDPNKKELPSKAEVDDRINKNLQMMKDNPDKLPLINQTRTRYALPRPINKKNFLFVPKKASIKDLADLVATYGAHTTKTFKKIAAPVPKEEKVRPINRYHDSQLAMLMSSEIVDNVPIIYTPTWKVNDSIEKGTPVKALLRGSSKQDKYLARTEEKPNSHGDMETYEVHYRKHDTYVSILTEEGVVEVRKGDKVAEILSPYASQLMQYVDENFKPLYDLNIDPFWGETFDNHKIEGVHDFYPAQEQVSTAMTEYLALEKFLLVSAEMRFGKAQPLDAKILTSDGWSTMGDIKVGDKVIGSDGKSHDVLAVFPQGKKPIYRVTFNDGGTTESCDEHLWTVNTSLRQWRNHPPKTMTLREIMKVGLRDGAGNYKFHIPIVDTIEFAESELPMDPYLLGVLIGDGSISDTQGSPLVCSADQEILDYVTEALPNGLFLKQKKNHAYDYRITSGINAGPYANNNGITTALKSLGLQGCTSDTKFIPKEYIYTSSENRIKLLQGLMDTDGSVEGKTPTTPSITTVSEQLAKDIQELVWSLGGLATINNKQPWYPYNGERKMGKPAFVVTIKLPPELNGQEFRLTRKKNLLQKRTKFAIPRRTIRSIEYVGEKEAQCIAVDAEDSLYITDDFIVTHNSPSSIALIKNLKKLHDLKVKAGYDDEARSVLDRLCKRLSDLRGYEVKPKDLGGIAPGEVVVITCPANMPDVWAKMIKLMLPEAKVERIKDVKSAGAFFRQAKTALPTEIYIAISTFEDLKLGGSWSGAWFEYSGKDAYRREVVDENGRQVKKVIKEKYCLDPTTGEQIYAGKDRHRARESDLDVNTYKNVRKSFFEGKVFQGYAEVINTNRYEQDFGKPIKVRDFKTALKRDGYALWQYERKYGFPKQGNGYVDFEEEEYIIPSRSGKMPYWNDKLMNHQNTLKPDGLREYTTKPRAIARKKYLRNLVNPGKRPPDVWLSMQGTRFYEKDGRTFRNPKHPVSDFICRKFSNQIALFIIDEVHAIQATSSGVSEAVRNIAFVAKKTVGLTGTLYRGLASSVYTLLFTFNPDVRQRFPWPYSTTPTEWIDAMGVWRMIFAHKNVYDNGRVTTSTKYEQVSISEAAGYSPEMFKLIAPCTIFATLEDLGQGVPDKTEIPTIIPMAPDQESLYMNVYGRLDQYNKRCIISGDYSFVGAYYQNVKLMLNGLFRPWTVIHNIRPVSNLKTAKPTPVEVLTIPSMGDMLQPKEEKLIERLTEMLADGRKCIVHIEQTGNDGSGGNPGRDISDRITSIIKNVPDANPFVLKAGSPAPAKRSEWIEKRVAEGGNILVCNPRLIKEGVDMSWASYTVFAEIPTRVDVLAQSMMRTMSLKQERDVIIEFMVYDDIFESAGLSYAASKMAAMAMVHGNSYGELAASSEDVDLQEDIMELIKAGRLEELENRRKNAAEQIGEQFKKIEYGKDITRSPWYAPPRKKKEETVTQ